MVILFRDDGGCIYLIREGILDYESSFIFPEIDLSKIPHIDDVDVLYHYRDIRTGVRHPVYYDHGVSFITSDKYLGYILRNIKLNYIRDYTLVNLKLL